MVRARLPFQPTPGGLLSPLRAPLWHAIQAFYPGILLSVLGAPAHHLPACLRTCRSPGPGHLLHMCPLTRPTCPATAKTLLSRQSVRRLLMPAGLCRARGVASQRGLGHVRPLVAPRLLDHPSALAVFPSCACQRWAPGSFASATGSILLPAGAVSGSCKQSSAMLMACRRRALPADDLLHRSHHAEGSAPQVRSTRHDGPALAAGAGRDPADARGRAQHDHPPDAGALARNGIARLKVQI